VQGYLQRHALETLAWQDDVTHTRLAGTLNDLIAVLVERVTINMAMTVYHFFPDNLYNILTIKTTIKSCNCCQQVVDFIV
jgi:hypothetical protein